MKRFRTSLAAKTAAVLLALAVGAGGFWSTVFILYQWDTLWLGSGYYDSNDYYSDLYNRSSQVRELARLLQNQEWNGALPYLDQRRLDMLEEALSPERTNFRFAIWRNDTGTLVYSNLEGAASLDESVHAVEQEELSLTQNGAAREQDYVVWNGKEQYYLLYIALPDAAGTKQLVPPEDAGLAAQYGYTFDGYTWNYDEQMDSRVTTSVLALEYGATDPLTVQDEFWDSYQDYQQYASYLPPWRCWPWCWTSQGYSCWCFCSGPPAGGRRRAARGATGSTASRWICWPSARFGPSLSFSTRGTRSPSASTYPNWPPTCWSACVSSP
ncbi:hypothetical protein HMPREF0995_03198 [Lachnospiraceae bacterium 7_1_58FAA]|nr:hypothetical protein HMPREF0995_03198 [Lachnospiraceae bacterium 7_1_58FAA]